jgi:quinol monooxygenase YgiN
MERRDFITAAFASAIPAAVAAATAASEASIEDEGYGLIGWIDAAPGRRDDLAAFLGQGTTAMPGCRLYLIAADAASPDRLWITETWDSREAHEASLNLPAVREAIRRGRPLIAAMERVAEMKPIPRRSPA